jgi:hypothetical protein
MSDTKRRLHTLAVACVLGVSTGTLAPLSAEAASCESLALLKLPNGEVTMAQTTAAGAFATPGDGRGTTAFARLPAFCRVAATLRPTPRSAIKAEVWLPVSTWNGKFQVVGNGGFAGTIPYQALQAIQRFPDDFDGVVAGAPYQGWADPGIPPRNVVTYYENVVKSTANAADAVRLFSARDGALWRWQRHEHVRHGCSARPMGRHRHPAGSHRSGPRARRHGQSHAAVVSLAAAGALSRDREH